MALEGKRISELTEVSRVNNSSKLPIDTGGEEALSITLENLMESGVNAAIEALQFITWVDVLPPIGSTKYLYAVPREEVDKDGHKIAALYLWDGTEWRGAGAFSLNIDPDTLATKTELAKYLPLNGGTVTGGLTISRNPGTREALFKLYNESNGQGATFFQSSGSTIIAANGGTNRLTLTFDSLVQEKNRNSYPILTTADKAVANGVASLDANAKVPSEQIPVATASTLGGVKPDGNTITVTEDGVISAVGGSGIKRPLGEVYFSQSSLATDNPGALPGWTGDYYENGKTLFPDLYNFVKAHSELQVTKTDYDNAIATYGECKKYVVDENEAQTSLRLPKYSRSHGTVIKEKKPTDTDATWYRQWSDGWLEQGGQYRVTTGVRHLNTRLTLLKAFADTNYTIKVTPYSIYRNTTYYTYMGMPTAGARTTTTVDVACYGVSDSDPMYGYDWSAEGMCVSSTAETPLYPWITAYTSAIPASTAQAAEFTGALAGKANTDLSNLSADGKDIASGLGMPSNRYIALTLGASGTKYTAPANGWFAVRVPFTGNQACSLSNANSLLGSQCTANGGWTGYTSIPTNKGDVITLLYNCTPNLFRFVYAEGAE